MGPCTFLVTAAVTGDKSVSVIQHARNTYSRHGIKGFYQGGTALMLRQGSNWASRQGFTDFVRSLFKKYRHGDENAKLTVMEEAISGIIGANMPQSV